ncbi:hypothetical protein ACWDBT_34035, partial [Streptomyces ardesiacus]
MDTTDATSWETALLTGGPVDGAHMRVTGRPWVIQVTRPCAPDDVPDGVRVEAVYVYRCRTPVGVLLACPGRSGPCLPAANFLGPPPT